MKQIPPTVKSPASSVESQIRGTVLPAKHEPSPAGILPISKHYFISTRKPSEQTFNSHKCKWWTNRGKLLPQTDVAPLIDWGFLHCFNKNY